MKRDSYQDERYITMNPFTCLTTQRSGQTEIRRRWKSRDGHTHEFVLRAPFVAGEYAEQVYNALLYFSFDGQRLRPSASAYQHELLDLMGWPSTGRYTQRLEEALHYLMSLEITTNTYRQRQKLRLLRTRVLASYEIAREGRYRRIRWEWAPDFIRQQREGDQIYLSARTYFALPSPTTRRIYRLMLAMTIPDGRPLVSDLKHFVENRLGAHFDRPSATARWLEPHLEELRRRRLLLGFIILPGRIVLARYPTSGPEALQILEHLPAHVARRLPPTNLTGIARTHLMGERALELLEGLDVVLRD